MRAVRLVGIGEPLQDHETPRPEIGDQEVLVRVGAAGICHSDVHYREGLSQVGPLPHTLGHEVAGVVAKVGAGVSTVEPGERVCLHYLVTCGACPACRSGSEQFCPDAQMLGKDIAGGYAEYVSVPAANAIPLADEVTLEHGAVLMCSSATVYHSLRKSRMRPGETAAVFGVGGLGMSAIQLARVFGALTVFAVDIHEGRLGLAERLGAIPVDAAAGDPAVEIRRRTGGRGVDVALGLVGHPEPMHQAVRSLAPRGRAVLAGLTDRPLVLDTYREILGREAEVIGCSDHLLEELPILVELTRQGRLDLSSVVTETVPLEAAAIERVHERIAGFGDGIRAVVTP